MATLLSSSCFAWVLAWYCRVVTPSSGSHLMLAKLADFPGRLLRRCADGGDQGWESRCVVSGPLAESSDDLVLLDQGRD